MFKDKIKKAGLTGLFMVGKTAMVGLGATIVAAEATKNVVKSLYTSAKEDAEKVLDLTKETK